MPSHRTTTLIVAATLLSQACAPLPPREPLQFGLEVQAYPAGVIPGLHVRRPVGDRDVVITRIAANLTERNDWGEHDDESGSGYGAGVGWRRYLGEVQDPPASTRASAALATGWHFGLRVDYWHLGIDWRDPGGREGTTDVQVLQPTAEFGYGWSDSGFGRLEATLGLGAEINVKTDGEDVGEGAIVLFGVTWIP